MFLHAVWRLTDAHIGVCTSPRVCRDGRLVAFVCAYPDAVHMTQVSTALLTSPMAIQRDVLSWHHPTFDPE